jgi:ATP-dependent Clp protease ATP-binding subunit ClpA
MKYSAGPADITANFTEHARYALALANQFARERYYHEVGPEHILLAMLRRPEGGVRDILQSLMEIEVFAPYFERRIPSRPSQGIGKLPYSLAGKEILRPAAAQARSFGHSKYGTEHLFLGILCVPSIAADELNHTGLTLKIVREYVARFMPPSPLTGDEYLDGTTAEQRTQALSKQQKRHEEERRLNELRLRLINWQQARMIREFVDSTKATAVQQQVVIPEGSSLDYWLQWAALQADKLDPITEMLAAVRHCGSAE